jgi:ketosteroid isomerase-like protein
MVNTVAVLLAAAMVGQTSTNDTADDSKVLSRLEETWNEAHLKGDADALRKLWGKDLVVTVPNMPAFSREQSLAVWKSGKFKLERYETSDVRIRLYSDAAVVTGRLQRTRRMGDRKTDDDWLFTKTYVRTKDGWQVVAFHASDAPKK